MHKSQGQKMEKTVINVWESEATEDGRTKQKDLNSGKHSRGHYTPPGKGLVSIKSRLDGDRKRGKQFQKSDTKTNSPQASLHNDKDKLQEPAQGLTDKKRNGEAS